MTIVNMWYPLSSSRIYFVISTNASEHFSISFVLVLSLNISEITGTIWSRINLYPSSPFSLRKSRNSLMLLRNLIFNISFSSTCFNLFKIHGLLKK